MNLGGRKTGQALEDILRPYQLEVGEASSIDGSLIMHFLWVGMDSDPDSERLKIEILTYNMCAGFTTLFILTCGQT